MSLLNDLIDELKALPEGDVIEVSTVIEKLEALVPVKAKAGRRGILAGLAIEDMSDEQLKREKINAGSVLYKAKQRHAEEATITMNQERFDAVVAELAKRKPAAPEQANEEVNGEVNEDVAAEL